MSGYTDDSLTESGVYEEDMILIEKPFSPDSLARRIRELLDEK